jgi:hypothetical protein
MSAIARSMKNQPVTFPRLFGASANLAESFCQI